MQEETHKCVDSYGCPESEAEAKATFEGISHSQGFVMASVTYFFKGRRSGLEWGAGLGEDVFVFKAGLKLRFL